MKREDTKTKVNDPMSTEKKTMVIEGFGANRFGEWQFDVAPDENDGWNTATLVIGERGIAESEVRKMIEEIKDQTLSTAFDKKVDAIAAKYGITPQPHPVQ